MKIPQCAPGRFYGAHSAEMEEAIRKVFAGGWYILGNEVRAFEEEFAAWCGCAGAVGVANGTDALELALRALRLPEKSRVAVPALTASATGMAVLRAGLTPVLVDLDQYRTMSVFCGYPCGGAGSSVRPDGGARRNHSGCGGVRCGCRGGLRPGAWSAIARQAGGRFRCFRLLQLLSD